MGLSLVKMKIIKGRIFFSRNITKLLQHVLCSHSAFLNSQDILKAQNAEFLVILRKEMRFVNESLFSG